MLIPKTKDGKEITGTLEQIEGVALLDGATRVDGRLELHYSGQTEVLWETQSSLYHDTGERQYVDSEGNLHVESDLVWEEATANLLVVTPRNGHTHTRSEAAARSAHENAMREARA